MKKTLSKHNQKRGRRDKQPPTTKGADRNPSLDSLRGLAILLMVLDHVAFLFGDVRIEPTTIRMATRLSMPLFAVLMGYFLSRSTRVHWERFWQLTAAACLMSFVYFSLYRQLEILASLWVCYLLFTGARRVFAFLFVAVFFYAWDPSTQFLENPLFDYPISLVVSCVSQGVILQRYGMRVAFATSLMVLPATQAWAGAVYVEEPTQYVLYFVPLAVLLVGLGTTRPQWNNASLALLGRYPLTAYIVQYLTLFALAGRLSL